jgi:hypothetical protein
MPLVTNPAQRDKWIVFCQFYPQSSLRELFHTDFFEPLLALFFDPAGRRAVRFWVFFNKK